LAANILDRVMISPATTSGLPRAKQPPLAAAIRLLLISAVLLLYWPATDHEFINFDDPHYVLENPHVARGLGLEALWWALTTTHASNWHPLTWISHMVDVRLFGLQAGGHHLTSIVLHALTAALLFHLFERTTAALWPSALLACVFALHPLQVESVAWVAERKNVLASLFWVLTLQSYTVYVRRPGWRWYGTTLMLFALGLMAKPMVITLPFVMVLLDHWPLRRLATDPAAVSALGRYWPLVREKLPFLLLSGVSALITIHAQHSGKAIQSLEAIPFDLRLINALISYGAYIGKFVWPVDLALYYPFSGRIGALNLVLAAGLVLAMTAVAVGLRRSRPFVLVGWLWYLGTLVPVIGLVQVGFQAMADRYAAIPLIGLCVMVIWGTSSIIAGKFKPVAVGVAGLALAGLSLATGRQLAHWQDSISLYTHTLAVARPSAPIHLNLGIALIEKGRTTEAMVNYLKAMQINPRHAGAHYNLALALIKTGKPDQALRFLDRALQLDPQMAEAHVGKALALMDLGQAQDARRHLENALQIDPLSEPARRYRKALDASAQWNGMQSQPDSNPENQVR